MLKSNLIGLNSLYARFSLLFICIIFIFILKSQYGDSSYYDSNKINEYNVSASIAGNNFTYLTIFLDIILFLIWLKFHKNKPSYSVATSIEELKLDPLMFKYVIDEKITAEALTGLLFFWMDKGLIRIEDKKINMKETCLYKIMDIPRDYPHYQKLLFKSIFSDCDYITLKRLHIPLTKNIRSTIINLESTVVQSGFFIRNSLYAMNICAIASFVFFIVLCAYLKIVSCNSPFFSLKLCLLIGISSIVSYFLTPYMTIRTKQGNDLRNCCLGLVDYLKSEETEAKNRNVDSSSSIVLTSYRDIFSQYLPYAIATNNIKTYLLKFNKYLPDISEKSIIFPSLTCNQKVFKESLINIIHYSNKIISKAMLASIPSSLMKIQSVMLLRKKDYND